MVERKKIPLFSLPSVKHRVGITTGDPKGIGRIVVQKAFQKLGVKKNLQFILWTSNKFPSLKIPSFKTKVFSKSEAALAEPFAENTLLEIKSRKSPGYWVEEAARLCLKQQLSSLITGPLSKRTLHKSHPGIIGHTDLFKQLTDTEDVFMVFLGSHFNVILLTDHIPLKTFVLNKERLIKLLKKALLFRNFLKDKRPLAVLGLNPHAGEEGLLGKEEKKILQPVLSRFLKKDVEGPLSPDAAFLRKNWKRYSFFVALYHDQGLIPFKMIHSHRGAGFSLGLPFIRTSVDHGTGIGLKHKDILPDSFLSALKYNVKFIRLAKDSHFQLV